MHTCGTDARASVGERERDELHLETHHSRDEAAKTNLLDVEANKMFLPHPKDKIQQLV